MEQGQGVVVGIPYYKKHQFFVRPSGRIRLAPQVLLREPDGDYWCGLWVVTD